MAKLAALLFAVQVMLVAFSVGAAAAPPALDRFGNVLCSSAGHAGADRPAGKNHADQPECCRLGCSFAGERLALPPVLSSIVQPRDTHVAEFVVSDVDRPCRTLTEKRARAPPVAV